MGLTMKHLKYSNQIVMSAIACGYLILILADIFFHINIMYLLAPYVVLSLGVVSYTKKRSTNYTKYYLGFELDLNSKGHILQFFIFAFNPKKAKTHNIEVIKYSQYQTTNIIDIEQLRKMLINLGYIVIIPNFIAKFNQLVVNRIYDVKADNSVGITTYYYEDILAEYNSFKSTVINAFKQNIFYLSDQTQSKHVWPSQPTRKFFNLLK